MIQTTTILIFDPEFGTHLEAFDKEALIWISNSEANRAASQNGDYANLTVFDFDEEEDTEIETCVEMLPALSEQNHWLTLEVYGMESDPMIESILEGEYNAKSIEATPYGFKVTRAAATAL